MSIDFEIPAEAKAIREKVRKWVHDECIPAEKELDTKPLAEVLGPLRKKARAQGLWCPFVPKEYGGMGLGPLANALVQMELGEHAGRALDEHAGAGRCLDDDNPCPRHGISEGKVPQTAAQWRQAHLLLDDRKGRRRRRHRHADYGGKGRQRELHPER
ncbi:acyl-CoA dehydrogenase family protein [Bradyrhizobium sp. TZ2]